MEYLGLALNTRISAPSQYAGYNFNSMAVFHGRRIGAGENGIRILEGSDDCGEAIDVRLDLHRTDFGSPRQKSLRGLLVGYETDGQIQITITDDQSYSVTKTLTPKQPGYQHGNRINGIRTQKGRYFQVRVENVDGSDIGLDALDALMVFLNR